ncbi:hypothetical protein ES703_99571 [subsurface metagenome]
MKILAIDPGETCGVAIFKDDKLIEATELSEKELLIHIEIDKPDVIIVEAYLHFPWVKDYAVHEYPTAELIGKIKLLAEQLNLRITTQPVGLVKSVITKRVLRHFDIKPYKSKHINDAIKHGLYYLKYRKKK